MLPGGADASPLTSHLPPSLSPSRRPSPSASISQDQPNEPAGHSSNSNFWLPGAACGVRAAAASAADAVSPDGPASELFSAELFSATAAAAAAAVRWCDILFACLVVVAPSQQSFELGPLRFFGFELGPLRFFGVTDLSPSCRSLAIFV